ncbi:SapC family protein [Paucibacter sp. APW11]|uniref:SapC family protein n=1 Tax=Roseateles aquae TaxID=3077235 RepID=A0ABU3PG12_9BURK|nr:SapC family protein [Paucibacter sp. APW11]MDT9001439.1 SapC family protein [Paucibacter sp. APW11]
MSTPPMYGALVPLDRELHKKLRLDTSKSTLDKVKGLNSLFLTVVEFAEACKEFPIVFVRVGEAVEGKPAPVAPLAVLGLKPGVNVIIKDDKWTANYTPAYLRRYPFAMARINEANDIAVCFDSEWSGFSESEGTPLFAEDGQPTEFTLNAKNFLEGFEQESERTRLACDALVAADLLQDMRFEATMPNGEKIDVEGFLTVNEQKLAELDDAKVLEFFRNGLLSVLELHRVSLGNMSRLAALHQPA